jgi:hypothetical protein
MRHHLETLTNGMELANKHHLGRKLRRSWLVSYIYHFNLAVYNLRTKLHYFLQEHQRMEFTTWISLRSIRFADLASSIPFGDFVSRISASLQFANKHHLGREPWLPWLVSCLKNRKNTDHSGLPVPQPMYPENRQGPKTVIFFDIV